MTNYEWTYDLARDVLRKVRLSPIPKQELVERVGALEENVMIDTAPNTTFIVRDVENPDPEMLKYKTITEIVPLTGRVTSITVNYRHDFSNGFISQASGGRTIVTLGGWDGNEYLIYNDPVPKSAS